MKISKGVEWAAHSCVLLAALPANGALALDTLAEFIDVTPPYLAKQMQLLSRHGIVSTKRGAKGGYRLAKLPELISLWDITAAIEGTSPTFSCTEVRQKGPCGALSEECRTPCEIAQSFYVAEAAFRNSLKSVSLADLSQSITREATAEHKQRIVRWLNSNTAVSK